MGSERARHRRHDIDTVRIPTDPASRVPVGPVGRGYSSLM